MARYTYTITLDSNGKGPNELEEFLYENLVMGKFNPPGCNFDKLSLKVTRDDFEGQSCYLTAKESRILERIISAEMPDDFSGDENAWDDARSLFYNYVHEEMAEV